MKYAHQTNPFKFRIPTSYKIAVFSLLALAAAIYPQSSRAQIAPDGVSTFFSANPELTFTAEAAYANRTVNYVAYRLIDSNQLSPIHQNFLRQGCVYLGNSSFSMNNVYDAGVPQKAYAMSYARAIGADIVLYTVSSADAHNRISHNVYFYASKSLGTRGNR
jgi:hypothetical protein